MMAAAGPFWVFSSGSATDERTGKVSFGYRMKKKEITTHLPEVQIVRNPHPAGPELALAVVLLLLVVQVIQQVRRPAHLRGEVFVLLVLRDRSLRGEEDGDRG